MAQAISEQAQRYARAPIPEHASVVVCRSNGPQKRAKKIAVLVRHAYGDTMWTRHPGSVVTTQKGLSSSGQKLLLEDFTVDGYCLVKMSRLKPA